MSQYSIEDNRKGSRPTPEEFRFLKIAYSFFYDIFEEVSEDEFWNKDPYYRFSKIRDAFLVYSELLDYEPIQQIIRIVNLFRPAGEGELAKDFLLFIRNILIHFPFFKNWQEIEFNRTLINWSTPGKSIDKFLLKFSGSREIKYRAWNPKKQEMIYASINFPVNYGDDSKIKLSDIISEKEGTKFCLSLMKSILDSQIAED